MSCEREKQKYKSVTIAASDNSKPYKLQKKIIF